MTAPTWGTHRVMKHSMITMTAADLWVLAPEIAAASQPGQFVMVRTAEKFLRRPISICEVDRAGGRLRLVVDRRGEGTAWLLSLTSGDEIDLFGPLGNGFGEVPAGARVALVGGGIGAPPLLSLAKTLTEPAAFLGFRSQDAVMMMADFALCCKGVTLCTDDGSLGLKGLVTEPLQQHLERGGTDLICACGPTPMLRAVAALGAAFGVPTLVSLEERMACGVGACLGCAVEVCAEDGGTSMMRVCKDGPVFLASKLAELSH